jgi:hypothetical protein
MQATSAGLLLACVLGTACAQDMIPPRIAVAPVDWDAVRSELENSEALRTLLAEPGGPTLTELNKAAARAYPAIPQSAVPVLLPIGAAAALRGPAEGSEAKDASNAEPRLTFLMTGPSGYDAAFAVRRPGSEGPDARRDVGVLISGSSLLYELDEPRGASDEPVKDKELAAQFSGIRRIFLEHHLRFAFVRFGVPYVVSTECYGGPSRGRRPSCTAADQLLTSFTKSCSWSAARHNLRPRPRPRSIGRPAPRQRSPTILPAGCCRTPAFVAAMASWTTRSMPKSGFRLRRLRLTQTPSRSSTGAIATTPDAYRDRAPRARLIAVG